jgi:hypothetical protein
MHPSTLHLRPRLRSLLAAVCSLGLALLTAGPATANDRELHSARLDDLTSSSCSTPPVR